MKSVPIVLLLAALVACGKNAEVPVELPPVTLPVAASGAPDPGEYPDDRVTISVDAKGYVHCQGKQVNLDELGSTLSNLKEVYELDMRAKGKSGFERLRGGGLASKLYVLLRADRQTPWQHIQWLMTILAEQKFYKLQLGVRNADDRLAKLDAYLRKDEELPIPREPINEIRVAVRIVAGDEVAAEWGPEGMAISKPTLFQYRLGDRTHGTLDHVRKGIEVAKTAVRRLENARAVGEIQAGLKVPLQQVVAVLNEFHEQGMKVDLTPALAGEDLHLWESFIPSMDVRERRYLPYPLENDPTPR